VALFAYFLTGGGVFGVLRAAFAWNSGLGRLFSPRSSR
jgi:hypothetical protein